LGTVELVGDEPPVPGEDAVWFGHASHLVQSFASESLADLSQRASLRIRQPQPCWQVRPENSILRSKVLVLKEEFLVDQPLHTPGDEPNDCRFSCAIPSSQLFKFLSCSSILTIRAVQNGQAGRIEGNDTGDLASCSGCLTWILLNRTCKTD
jgi:hypothetical protein